MLFDPNTAFVLVAFGVLAIYCEFVLPGRVYPGLAGAVGLATGGYFLEQNGPAPGGLALVAVGAVLLVLEALWKVNFLAGVFGTISIAGGFCGLFVGPRRIAPGLAIPSSIVLGGLGTLLARGAKQARRNKWSDINRANHGSA